MKVFVYGNLKRGGSNHYLLEGMEAKFLAECMTLLAEYTMHDVGQYPGVMEGGSTTVKGELYEVSDLRAIDFLEGYPDLYYRKEVQLSCNEIAYMYFYNRQIGDETLIIDTGVWELVK